MLKKWFKKLKWFLMACVVFVCLGIMFAGIVIPKFFPWVFPSMETEITFLLLMGGALLMMKCIGESD